MNYPELHMLIDGEKIPVGGRRSHPVVNPATGEILGQLPLADAADLDRALQAAQRGFHRAAVLAEFGVALPDDVRISVWDSTSEARYMVLPVRPAGTAGMTVEELARHMAAHDVNHILQVRQLLGRPGHRMAGIGRGGQ